MLRDLVGKSVFSQVNAEFLVGLQNGITQPEALSWLDGASNVTVRAPFAAQVLASKTLHAKEFFHPKIFYLENTVSGQAAVISASANLTYPGLKSNFEQALVHVGTANDFVSSAFHAWWPRTWQAAQVVTPSLIAQYTSARAALKPQTPSSKIVSAPAGPPAQALQTAQRFWIELTRPPEGGSFNQVETLLNGHLFFFPQTSSPSRRSPLPLVFIDAQGTRYSSAGRQIVFNGPPIRKKGNSMWRIYMPTEHEGLTGYQDGDVLIRFTRTAVSGEYLVEIADATSAAASNWIGTSKGVASIPGPPARRMGWA